MLLTIKLFKELFMEKVKEYGIENFWICVFQNLLQRVIILKSNLFIVLIVHC